MATTDSDEQSLFDRGRERLRDATRSGKQGVKKATDTFTGKALEDSIAEYTDVYTQVLLGINARIEEEASRLDTLESDNKSMRIELNSKIEAEKLLGLRSQITGISGQLKVAKMIAAGAIVLSLVSLAGVIWMAI